MSSGMQNADSRRDRARLRPLLLARTQNATHTPSLGGLKIGAAPPEIAIMGLIKD